MRLLYALMLAMLTSCFHPVHADQIRVISGSWSNHMSSDGYKEDGRYKKYNEEHESYGLSYYSDTSKGDTAFTRSGHQVFRFTNSYDRESYGYLYNGHECTRHSLGSACLGYSLGVSTGYSHRGYPVLPVAGLGGSLSVEPVELFFMYVPFANVLTFQVSTELMEW